MTVHITVKKNGELIWTEKKRFPSCAVKLKRKDGAGAVAHWVKPLLAALASHMVLV